MISKLTYCRVQALYLLGLGLVHIGPVPATEAKPGFGVPLRDIIGEVTTVTDVAGLKAAVEQANEGGVPSTILLADGTYMLDVPVLELACPGLILRGASGDRERVVVRGPDEGPTASAHHVFLVSADQVTVADLTMGWCRYHGVQIRGESPYNVAGSRISNCRILNCNEQFIKGSSRDDDPVGATDGLIEGCWFEFTAGWAYQDYTGGIDIHKGVNWVVRDNRFVSIRSPAHEPSIAEHAIHFWKRCPTLPQRVTIERNWIVNCDRGIGFGLGNLYGGFQGGGSIIRNNLIANDGVGPHTDVGIGLEYADAVTVDNNTVYTPTYWAPIEYRFGGSSNLVFRNNLVNAPIRNRDQAPPATLLTNVDSASADWFVDAPAGDLRLAAGATDAIDGGTPLNSFLDDVDGHPRPVLAGWDVGAHEFVPDWVGAVEPGIPEAMLNAVPLRSIHVAPAGNDTDGDGSPERPYATLGFAANLATPGTAVRLAPGTYPGGTFLYDLTGTADAPIWIGGEDPAQRPVLQGGTEGLHLVRPRFVIVESLEVAGASGNGINADDGGDYANPEAARFVVFRNLWIHDIGGTGNQDGLKLSGLNDYRVLDSGFARCGGDGSGSGIDHVGCHRGIIARNSFETMVGNAVQCKGGSAEIDIVHCRIRDAGERGINIGGSTGPAFFRPPLSTTAPNVEARSIRVVANLFVGGTAPVAFVGCRDALVAHNSIVNPDHWLLRILQESVSGATFAFEPCGNSAFVNNMVYFRREALANTDINVGPNTDPASFRFAHNLWYAHDEPTDSEPDLPGPESGGLVGRDPLVMDPAAEDYTFDLSSPAARAGIVLPTLETDVSGEPFLTPPSLGAWELVGDRDGDRLPDAWEFLHFGATNRTDGADTEDADRDAFPDRSEQVAGTDPLDPHSRLRIEAIRSDPAGPVDLRWPSAPGRTYDVERASDHAHPTRYDVLDAGIPAAPPGNRYRDPAPSVVTRYRIAVDQPQ